MASEDSNDKPARAPRGAKPVAKAFFTALDALPDATRGAVAKAAQVMIRDQLKLRRDKLREAAAKEKARRPGTAKPAPLRNGKLAAAASATPAPAAAAKTKRRARKPGDALSAA